MKRFPRRSGILLHPTALPNPYGIGTLGGCTLKFLDWLKESGQSYWQLCPLVPTGYGDSPYQGFSALAGNPNLIDLEDLIQFELLTINNLVPLTDIPDRKIDFGKLIPLKSTILHMAWQRFSAGSGPQKLHREFSDFLDTAKKPLSEYCLFMAIKENQGGKPWYQWPTPLKLREQSAMEEARGTLKESVNHHTFLQFLFSRQWKRIRKAANRRGISIIGDLPIFVAHDSSDCWARSELFQLDKNRNPTHVAGVPPDYFSRTGQLWGNPLYDWKAMERDGFQWWISLLSEKFAQYDILRIDHFRGFAACWAVPFGEETAVHGAWMPSPGHELFTKVNERLKNPPIIAEDLGVITKDVRALMNAFGYPGMKVLQFAFDSSEENDYLPHKYDHHCIVYSGTHDNDTTVGWYEKASERDKTAMRTYLNLPERISSRQAAKALVEAAMASKADLAITPLQDMLGLGSVARFNTPGSTCGNWSWRAPIDAFSPQLANELHELTRNTHRISHEIDSAI